LRLGEPTHNVLRGHVTRSRIERIRLIDNVLYMCKRTCVCLPVSGPQPWRHWWR